MFLKRLIDRSKRNDGFAMPLTLAVLLVLSYIIAIGLQRLEVSRAEARLAQSTIRDMVESTQIEQDVLWRGIVEILGQEVSALGLTENRYLVREPDNEWNANARAFIWSPTYASLTGDDFPSALVVIVDEASKIDLNHRSEGYMRLLADRARLGAGQADRAVSELQTYVRDRTPAPLAAGNVLRVNQRSGFLDPVEICILPSWKSWEFCEDPEALRETFTAGVGLVPNIRMMTPDNARYLLDRNISSEIYELEQQWTQLRIAYGFFSPIEGIGSGGERFTVTIIPQSSQRAFRFELDMRIQETDRPFAIRNRRYLPSDPLIEGYRQDFPSVVTRFLSQ